MTGLKTLVMLQLVKFLFFPLSPSVSGVIGHQETILNCKDKGEKYFLEATILLIISCSNDLSALSHCNILARQCLLSEPSESPHAVTHFVSFLRSKILNPTPKPKLGKWWTCKHIYLLSLPKCLITYSTRSKAVQRHSSLDLSSQIFVLGGHFFNPYLNSTFQPCAFKFFRGWEVCLSISHLQILQE